MAGYYESVQMADLKREKELKALRAVAKAAQTLFDIWDRSDICTCRGMQWPELFHALDALKKEDESK